MGLIGMLARPYYQPHCRWFIDDLSFRDADDSTSTLV